MKYTELAKQSGIETCLEFNPEMLVPEERIRAFCSANRCGSYGRNYTCPPHAGTLEEISTRLRDFPQGLLLQYSRVIDVRKDRKGVIQTRLDFHLAVLRLEESLRQRGVREMWGLIGGNCGLCETCQAVSRKPCRHPEKARMSLEAIGVDVIGLLDKLGLDSRFHSDRITWTGCILFKSPPG